MNYTIENKGGVNLLHIGDTVRPATDAEADLVAQLQRANDCIRQVRLRLHFVDWPGESMWGSSSGYWIPDWRYEAQLMENVLFGTEITTPERPTDTRKRCEVLFRPQRVYAKPDGNVVFEQLPLRDWPEWARSAMPEGVEGPKPTVQVINGDVVGTVSDEQIHVVLMDALHRIAERNGYPEWAHSGPSSDVFEAYKSWPEDLRARLSVNDLRRMSGWSPQPSVESASLSMVRDIVGDRIEVPVEAWSHPDTLRLDWIIQKASDSYTGVTLDASRKNSSRVMWHHHVPDYSSTDLRQAIDREMRNGN